MRGKDGTDITEGLTNVSVPEEAKKLVAMSLFQNILALAYKSHQDFLSFNPQSESAERRKVVADLYAKLHKKYLAMLFTAIGLKKITVELIMDAEFSSVPMSIT